MENQFQVIEARTPADFIVARELIEEYQRFLNRDLCFQGFAKELEELSVIYGSPKGKMFLLTKNGTACGCVGLRDFSQGVAEMKRMYVKPECTGQGAGRLLAEHFIQAAKNLGYHQIVLDTVPELQRAITLYRNLGFQEIPAYRFNPDPAALFFALPLRRP
ncbi:MAG: GCN5-related N-acetyltransferase [Verrucomicrobiales bacterium]|nr:GCN5-related N-acetyltransferase [Verrucomicrobiales bacterium]